MVYIKSKCFDTCWTSDNAKLTFLNETPFLTCLKGPNINFINLETRQALKTILSENDFFRAFDSFENILITANFSGLIKIWDLKENVRRKTLSFPIKDVSDIKINYDGKLAAFSTFKKTVQVSFFI